jgi:hypothetical protein
MIVQGIWDSVFPFEEVAVAEGRFGLNASHSNDF